LLKINEIRVFITHIECFPFSNTSRYKYRFIFVTYMSKKIE